MRFSLQCVIWIVLCVALLLKGAHAQETAPTLANQEEAAVRAAVDRVADSVVQIRTIGGLEEIDRTLLPDGPTTGLVVSTDGWILASAFNFVQQPASIIVTFASGEQAPATLVAKDHSRMLVLLKAQGVDDQQVPEIAPTDAIRVGHWAIAVGRTFRADQVNVSVGIVSALNRMFGKVLQTDADVSTANYGGPLVDIQGRVLGVIVPIAPQTTSEVAGAEWYDSGIGFAVPLADYGAPLERMKQGEDQYGGILGVSLTEKIPHASPAEVAVSLPNSPAGKAGLRKGDRIVQLDGRPIRTLTELRFALGTRYAGEKVELRIARGDEEFDQTLTLVGELESFRHGFFGILPMRDAADEPATSAEDSPKNAAKLDEDTPVDDDTEGQVKAGEDDEDVPGTNHKGVVVRAVFTGSPAAKSGIRPGDRIVRIDEQKIADLGDVFDVMNSVMPDATATLGVMRDDRPVEFSLTAGRMPAHVPNSLPPAYASRETPNDDDLNAAIELHDLKLAEFSETCQVYVPPSLEVGREAGMLLWLHAPGEVPDVKLFQHWQSICDRDGLLLIAPTATDPAHWDRTELEYLRRLVERVLAQYRIDRRRVVVYGEEGGGSMAYLLALASRDVFTGVATAAAALPRTVKVPPNQPTTRLKVYAALAADDGRMAQIQFGLKKLADAGYPVTTVTIANSTGELSRKDEQELVHWIDSLDAF